MNNPKDKTKMNQNESTVSLIYELSWDCTNLTFQIEMSGKSNAGCGAHLKLKKKKICENWN